MNYARWATKEEMLKFLKEVDINSDIKKSGIPMGYDKNKLYIKDDNSHTIIIGAPGSGKTQGVMLPQIKLAIKAGESLFINDVKGEILDEIGGELKNNNYIIASCNQGLFTYGGHFIVLVGIEGNYIKIYDSYLYNGKYDVASRRGKAIVKGHTTYVSIENFRQYANYRKFFCFKNDRTDTKENNTSIDITESSTASVNYQVKITANSGLNIRAGASTSYARVGGYSKGDVVTILAESNGFGKTDKGWISLNYTTKNIGTSNTITTSGQTKRLARASILYSNSNLTGYRYNYKANTTVTVIENVSETIDKVRVNVTGRVAYINKNNYTNVANTKAQSTTTRRTKACILYSNSNLSGVRYQYKANTTVTILQHVNSYVDKVRVNATGRIAYINVNNYK